MAQLRKDSRAEEKGSTKETTTNLPLKRASKSSNTDTARRPDLTRIQTNTTSATDARRDSNDPASLNYSASTSSSTRTANPHRLSTSNVADALKPLLKSAASATEDARTIPGLTFDNNMSKFTVLDQEDEDNLHAKRLLNIEEKPFKRIQKRLLTTTNPIQEYLRRTPTDASATKSAQNGSGETVSEPENDEADAAPKDDVSGTSAEQPKSEEEVNAYLKQLEQFTHSTLHDFSSLTTSLARLQFLLTANQKERERYATQSQEIQSQHVSIREDTSNLRLRLAEARRQLEVRKGWDVLAEKVLWVDGKVGGERVKTRDELSRESDKLRSEIEELDREGEELNQQWLDRRAALQDVVEQNKRLRRVIRGEPEKPEDEAEKEDEERSEMEGEGRREDDDEHLLPGVDVEGRSNAGTPRPEDGGATPLPHADRSRGTTPMPIVQESGGMTPRSMVDEGEAGTPRPATQEGGSSLKHETQASSDDAEMVEAHPQTLQDIDVPELKVDDAEKAEVEVSEMDTT